VIPVFDEQEEVARIVHAVRARLTERGGEWEILVIDNASTDATVQFLEPLLVDHRIRLLRNERNFGKGYSVRRGMLEACGDRRLLCDADCCESLVSLPRMEELLASAGVVAGSRNSDGATVTRYQPLYRRAVSILFIMLCRWLMSEPLSDVFCGFKLFSATAAEDAFREATVDGWAFDAEVVALARAAGHRVVACGIVWGNRRESRLSIPRTALPALRDLYRVRARLRRQTVRSSDPAIRGPSELARASAPVPRPAAPPPPPRPSERRSGQSHS
jgi:dolichyl-phosphate beta-glucosyltransferase